MGDNHARGCFPLGDRLFLSHGTSETKGAPQPLVVKAKKRWIGRTGSFLKGYVENESSYVVDAALAPCNLGWIEFTLTLKRDRREGGNICTVEIGAKQ